MTLQMAHRKQHLESTFCPLYRGEFRFGLAFKRGPRSSGSGASPLESRRELWQNCRLKLPPMNPSTPQPTRYRGSCPACGHGTMMPLARFSESDVNEAPTIDSFVPNRGFARFMPGASLFLMLASWFGSLFFGKAKVARGRAKVRHARETILPRSPNAAICPNCYEALERE